ncbi:hypothetical protein PsorP6_006612 [Peronosclerospora sorghi]|uniref:Uncharacterized protein n=1 Tax=Peronosclerospora sorghi TaxID=230839 RepID=A0ACC0W2Z9_9STRA|nr:hypothetical protein PsorP6_006612 [Peronosclerospora sorghi]
MSKSLGNVVDPHEVLAKYGSDFVRFYLLRDGVRTNDGNFNAAALEDRVNTELADTLGNLVSRCTGKSVLAKGKLPKRPERDQLTPTDEELVAKAQTLRARSQSSSIHLTLHAAWKKLCSSFTMLIGIAVISSLVSSVTSTSLGIADAMIRYFSSMEPWALSKRLQC